MADRVSPMGKPRIAERALSLDRRAFEAAGHDLYRSSSGRSSAAIITFSLQACS